MKKRSLLMLLPGMLFLCAGFVSCSDSGDDVDKINTLEVAPSANIQFKASGNADAVLEVSTDAESWSYTAPDWVTAKKEGKTLTVNAKDNATGGSRAGRIEFNAGTARSVVVNVSQGIPVPGEDNVLSVDPSDDIAFKAKGNADVVLEVSTDADAWEYEVPEWVTARKDGNKLTVNAKDNTTDGSRAGRLTFSAGTAKEVVVNVTQELGGDEPEPDPDKVAGSLKDESGKMNVAIEVSNETSLTAHVRFELDAAAAAEVSVQIYIDAAYLTEYNFINQADCRLFPENLVSIANDGNVTLPAGETASGNIALALNLDSEAIQFNVEYLIPVCVRTVSDNVSVANSTKRVNYVLSKKNPKEVKNVLYYEVNDTNPLNTLEYVLADGTYFFDAIILFAANINYNASEDRVYLNNNPNVQALLDESEVYLQPLREKGIKVYLGLLGNHDAAGLCQLSDWGCEQFAMELAMAVEEYKLDGVNFDDEYSGSPIVGNKWFTNWSNAAGSRLCYETKKAMKEIVPWETELSLFAWGGFGAGAQTVEGQKPGEFVDFWMANYGGGVRPLDGMTMKGCSGMSIECNNGTGYIDEDSARRIKEKGYGWVMWFAFNPSPTSNLYNLETSLPMMKGAALGLYDQELPDPTGYYKKIGEGRYDSQRYTF